MGLTPADFLRALPMALEGLPYRVARDSVSIQHPEGGIEIGLVPAPDRRIASLALPVTRVTFRFRGLTPGARAGFLKRLDLHLQRGGG